MILKRISERQCKLERLCAARYRADGSGPLYAFNIPSIVTEAAPNVIEAPTAWCEDLSRLCPLSGTGCNVSLEYRRADNSILIKCIELAAESFVVKIELPAVGLGAHGSQGETVCEKSLTIGGPNSAIAALRLR